MPSAGITKLHHFVTPAGAATKAFLRSFLAPRGPSADDLFLRSLFNVLRHPDPLLKA
jgi:hypothetical protein